ncbi:response regulator [Flavobacterium terrae]|uniref:Response regulator receiver domain-containing protein n=1 Tax=Flavobacterium terrae TaxID=415425 RepID=A0A1M6HF98_9FLAO|nr:response regulator [Flavobacterium terrae]SHJ20867.1 Response regulator receiver domain-containing protein [Flavobacterium terrae]
MKILIFENEFFKVENAFNYVNERYFNGNLEFTILPKSQDLVNLSDMSKYDYIFLDISLAKKSDLDGFGILKKIEEENISIKKLTILTGNGDIKNKLRELGLKDYPVLLKPVVFSQLYDNLKSLS